MVGTVSSLQSYFDNLAQWRQESLRLRSILAGFPLKEELKWNQPCYTSEGKNIAIISGFKEYCVLGFFKGALMVDPHGILVAPGKVQAARQIRFTCLREITSQEPILKTYIAEAIAVEKSGSKVELKPHSEYTVPTELQQRLDAMPRLKKAFQTLTPGRQRGYMLHISAPKQAKTRESRVDKCMDRILDGKGLND
jgi:uncharacterized protein YdeI (YjbR/CyaY-like superfamily)